MGANDAAEQLAVAIEEVGKLERELAGALAVIERVRVSRSNHPECDVHPDDDPVSCGWKRAVIGTDKALATSPPDALDAVKAAAWDEGRKFGELPQADKRECVCFHPAHHERNPYRNPRTPGEEANGQASP